MNGLVVKISLCAISIVSIVRLNALTIMKGNAPEDSTATFTMSVGPAVFFPPQGGWIVGAKKAPDASFGSWSLAWSNGNFDRFFPLAGSSTLKTLDGKEIVNPLFGATIYALDRLGQYPVVVTDQIRNVIFCIVALADPQNPMRFASIPLVDSNNQQAAITALTTLERVDANKTDSEVIELTEGMRIFALVQPASGVFGDSGSCLTDTILTFDSQTTKKLVFFTGAPLPITRDNGTLNIGVPLASMGPKQSLSCNNAAKRVYAGFTSTSGTGPTAGAYSVLWFTTGENAPLEKVIPESAIPDGGECIIAAKGEGVTVSALQVESLITTTLISMLIVNGSVGSGLTENDAARWVFALPTMGLSGALADIREQPTPVFSELGIVSYRTYPNAATTPGSCYTTTSQQAQVGNGILPGPATKIFVSGEAVYAAVAETIAPFAPGIYHSQPLFNQYGGVIGWTPWRIVGSVAQPAYQCAIDAKTGFIWTITGTVLAQNTITRTEWTAATSLSSAVQNSVARNESGVQEIIDLPKTSTPSQTSLIAAVGYRSLTLLQADSSILGITIPTTDFSNGFLAQNGTLQGFTPGGQWLGTEGGALDSLGAITSCAVATDGTYGWIVAGGSGGCAVLCMPNGLSWTELSYGFNGLDDTFQWVNLPYIDATHQIVAVEKLIADGTHLYILTKTALYRIDITSSWLTGANPQQATCIARTTQTNTLHQTFADCFIKHDCALIATSTGLIRNAAGTHVSSAQQPEELAWTSVLLPWAHGPVTRIFPIGPLELDATNFIANIYTLNGTVAQDRCTISRLTLQYSGAMTEDTVQLLPDLYKKDLLGYFLGIGTYRNSIATNGTLLLTGRSRYGLQTAFAEILSPRWHIFLVSYSGQSQIVQRAYRMLETPNTPRTGRIAQSSASGAWLIPYGTSLISNA